MKLFKLLFCVALLSSIAACNGDDESLGSVDVELVGEWRLTEVDASGTSTTTVLGVSEDSQFTGEGVNMTTTMTLEEDGGFSTTGDYDILLTRVVLGQEITNTWDEPTFIDFGTWGKNGDDLVIATSDGMERANIVSMDDTTLVLDWRFQSETNVAGTKTVRDVDGRYTFTKQ